MFNLTEAFKQGYETYLKEETEKSFEEAINGLEESQKEAEESFEIVREYFNLYALSEGVLNEKEEDEGKLGNTADKKSNKETDATDVIKNLLKLGTGIFGDQEKAGYNPLVGNVTVQKITEMKFPQNIIFFIQTLIAWLGNLVRKFISFITQGIQRLFGLPVGDDFKGDLTLHLEKAKKIESIGLPLSGFKGKEPKAASMYSFDSKNLEEIRSIFDGFSLKESVELTEAEKDARDPNNPANADFRNQTVAIKVDISKEMEDLHSQLLHFLDLFDNAYGSNQEHLFQTEDLQLLLELFRAVMEAISSGDVPTYAIQGKLTELETINKERLKDNLIRTKINTENLKRAYVETQERIVRTLQILTQKQLLAAEGLGVSFRFYSAATYVQMIKILQVIKPRIKDSEKMEAKLKKMGEIFNKVVIELGKQRSAISNFGPVIYTPVYQRKVNDLFDASRFVSQTITLRLALLGLYIRQLKDIREALENANSINSRAKEFLKKGIFSGITSSLFR
jgi:hypothetical protein